MRHTEKEDGNVEVVIRHGAKPFIGWTLTEVCAIWAGFEICGTRTGFASFAVLQTVLMSVLYGLCVCGKSRSTDARSCSRTGAAKSPWTPYFSRMILSSP